MPPNEGEKSWFEYRALVLQELERANLAIAKLHEKIEAKDGETNDRVDKINREHNEDMGKLRERLVKLETRATMLGALAGLVVSIGIGLLKFFPLK